MANEGFLWLAGLAIFASLISLYYYLKVIRQMYIEPVPNYDSVGGEGDSGVAVAEGNTGGTVEALSPSIVMTGVLVVGLAAVVLVGVYPAPLVNLIQAASQAIVPGA